MAESKKDEKSSPRDADESESDGEEAVEELAGLFGAGPKAPPPTGGPIEGEQYAP